MKNIFKGLILCLTLIFATTAFSLKANAATNSFSASIKCGSAGYGSVKGIDNGVTYSLSKGSVTISVNSVTSGGIYSVYLYKKGSLFPVGQKEGFKGTTSFTVSDLSAGTYYLKLAVSGVTNSTYNISGTIKQ